MLCVNYILNFITNVALQILTVVVLTLTSDYVCPSWHCAAN